MTKINGRSTNGTARRSSKKNLEAKFLLTLASGAIFFLLFRSLRQTDDDGYNKGQNSMMRLGKLRDGAARQHGGGGGGRRSDGTLSIRQAMTDPNYDSYAKQQAHQILSGHASLIDVKINIDRILEDDNYSGITAEFCPLNFKVQKENPPETPMFRDLVDKSDGCVDGGRENVITVDLKEAVLLAREFDQFAQDNDFDATYYNVPNQLQLKGVVFHESRCGSTLAANTMLAMNPVKHRVYSESAPPINAMMACGELYDECSLEASANLLRDVIYMMGRSNDPNEENVFFKFQSMSTRNMATFRKAFPNTPWIFLYREPVEVMMSQLDVPKMKNANCVRTYSEMVMKSVARSGYQESELENEEWCAIYLATICESAIKNLNDADGLGMAVNYHKDLTHDFIDTVFPKHFSVPLDQEAIDRVIKVSATYSKNRGEYMEGEFKSDSEKKKKMASEGIRQASSLFLEPSFHSLQTSRYNIKNK
jgi:hypothetical protein